MQFPTIYSSTFKIDEVTRAHRELADLVLHFEASLRSKDFKVLYHKWNSINFKCIPRRGYGIPLTFSGLVSSGYVVFSEDNGSLVIGYTLRFGYLLGYIAAMIFALAILPIGRLGFLHWCTIVVAFGLFYFGIIFFTVWQFEEFLKQTLQSNVAG